MNIILASASPRRRELLTQIFPRFEVIPFEGEEIAAGNNPSEIVMSLSAQKADFALRNMENPSGDQLIIGADTTVVLDGEILGKPLDEADAFRMLRALSGRTHQVYTGVTLILAGDSVARDSFFEKTDVSFYPMSEEEIRDYVLTGDPYDKAGAYGIQSGAGKYISGINGDYNNVVGLPVARLYREIKKLSARS